jgi:hypothetical protein
MRYVDGRHGPGPLRTDATFATAVLPPGACPVGARGLPPCEARMLNGSIHAFGELAYQDTVPSYLQLVLRQAAEEFPAALAE